MMKTDDSMEYSKNYTVKEEHIDVQGIMDGLYYPKLEFESIK